MRQRFANLTLIPFPLSLALIIVEVVDILSVSELNYDFETNLKAFVERALRVRSHYQNIIFMCDPLCLEGAPQGRDAE